MTTPLERWKREKERQARIDRGEDPDAPQEAVYKRPGEYCDHPKEHIADYAGVEEDLSSTHMRVCLLCGRDPDEDKE